MGHLAHLFAGRFFFFGADEGFVKLLDFISASFFRGGAGLPRKNLGCFGGGSRCGGGAWDLARSASIALAAGAQSGAATLPSSRFRQAVCGKRLYYFA